MLRQAGGGPGKRGWGASGWSPQPSILHSVPSGPLSTLHYCHRCRRFKRFPKSCIRDSDKRCLQWKWGSLQQSRRPAVHQAPCSCRTDSRQAACVRPGPPCAWHGVLRQTVNYPERLHLTSPLFADPALASTAAPASAKGSCSLCWGQLPANPILRCAHAVRWSRVQCLCSPAPGLPAWALGHFHFSPCRPHRILRWKGHQEAASSPMSTWQVASSLL